MSRAQKLIESLDALLEVTVAAGENTTPSMSPSTSHKAGEQTTDSSSSSSTTHQAGENTTK